MISFKEYINQEYITGIYNKMKSIEHCLATLNDFSSLMQIAV